MFDAGIFCTSSELNAERPKTPLKEFTADKAFKLKHSQWFKLPMSTEEVQKHRRFQNSFRSDDWYGYSICFIKLMFYDH